MKQKINQVKKETCKYLEDIIIHTFYIKKTKGRAERILTIQADREEKYLAHSMF